MAELISWGSIREKGTQSVFKGHRSGFRIQAVVLALRSSDIDHFTAGWNVCKWVIWCAAAVQTAKLFGQGSCVSGNVHSWNSYRLPAPFLEKQAKEPTIIGGPK